MKILKKWRLKQSSIPFLNVMLLKVSKSDKWRKLKIGQKYGVALWLTLGVFTLSTILSFFMLVYSTFKLNEAEKASERALEIADIGTDFYLKGGTIGNYIIDSNPKHLNTYEELETEIKNKQQDIQQMIQSEKAEEMFSKINEYDKEVNQLFYDEIAPNVKLQHVREYRLGKLQVDNYIEQTMNTLDELISIVKAEQESAINQASWMMIVSLVILVLSLVLSAIFGFFSHRIVNKQLAYRLTKVVTASKEITKGNLKASDIHSNNQDEITEIADAFNQMKHQLRQMIQEMLTVSQSLNERSVHLGTVSSEVAAASQEISATMEELSGGAEEQASASADLSKIMEDYLYKVENAESKSVSMREAASNVKDMTLAGNELMENSKEQMNRIDEIINDSMHRVKGLDQETKQITKLISVIHDIANQTNLLALNAAIEAARAGEHGKGFAVVAEEVRKLAEKVSYSISDITSIVNKIQSESVGVVKSLQAGYEQVEIGSNKIHQTANTFHSISTATTAIHGDIEYISSSMVEMLENSVVMSESIENIAAVSQQSAAAVEETSNSVTHTNDSMENIQQYVQKLAEMANTLNKLIEKFKL
ncbi:methyl-accepting chemotaxis protein [Cytobacillus sp. FSL K6-0265]|uniref:methyl-accepting chemotaxis protein n=1 Tax=Cytobacillus sp. FSL K6-0265 TaxID=2921448 RepID=UPI0030F93A95